MTAVTEVLGLADGWTCWIEVQRGEEGFYAGRADLRQDGTHRCVFVLARQPTPEAALARAKFRADHFIQEWATRTAASHGLHATRKQ